MAVPWCTGCRRARRPCASDATLEEAGTRLLRLSLSLVRALAPRRPGDGQGERRRYSPPGPAGHGLARRRAKQDGRGRSVTVDCTASRAGGRTATDATQSRTGESMRIGTNRPQPSSRSPSRSRFMASSRSSSPTARAADGAISVARCSGST